MKTTFRALAAAALAATALPALADVTATDVWARATVPKQTATGAFMTLKSTTDLTLVGASSPVAGIVEVHEMHMKDNVMYMRAVDDVPLPAGKAVDLKPGGFHVMLIELVKPLKAGDKVPITLILRGPGSKQTKLEVTADVRGPGAGPK